MGKNVEQGWGVGGAGSTQPVTKGGRLLFYEYEVGLFLGKFAFLSSPEYSCIWTSFGTFKSRHLHPRKRSLLAIQHLWSFLSERDKRWDLKWELGKRNPCQGDGKENHDCHNHHGNFF